MRYSIRSSANPRRPSRQPYAGKNNKRGAKMKDIDLMTDDDCKAELAESGFDVSATDARLELMFEQLRKIAKKKDAEDNNT